MTLPKSLLLLDLYGVKDDLLVNVNNDEHIKLSGWTAEELFCAWNLKVERESKSEHD